MSDTDDPLSKLIQDGSTEFIKQQLGIRRKVLWYILIAVALVCFIIMCANASGYEKLSGSWVNPTCLITGGISIFVAIIINPYRSFE